MRWLKVPGPLYGSDMPSLQPAPETDEAAIRRVFGNRFVDWILATDGLTTLTPEQTEVAAFIHRTMLADVPESVPAHIRLSGLTGTNPQTGKPLLAELRQMAGGVEPVLPESPDDEVLSAMQQWAAENFGGLLLGGGSSLSWGSAARERMTRAIAADPTLPFTAESTPGESLFHITSAGSAGGLQLAVVGPGIVTAAFRQAASRRDRVQPEDVLAELPAALNAAREISAGKTVQTLALAGLAGVLLPEEKPVLSAPWGRLRASRETDNTLLGKGQDVTMALPDGSQLVSQGTGDLTVETTVPWSAELTQPPAQDEFPHLKPSTSLGFLQRRVEIVRLAFSLAMADPQLPALLPTWEKVENPMSEATGFSIAEIARLRPRTPTRLSVEQACEWERWIAVLDGLALENLGYAPQRLLRAITERQDPVDALVDAVIVWEAIFGTHNEITFRVCGSLARLLHSTVEDRLAFVKKAKNVYTVRSKIVHGASDIKPEKINALRDEAIQVAIAAFRVLTQDRKDLLAITSSSERSDRIMLE